MKKILTTLLFAITIIFSAQSQEVIKHKWHDFVIGGENGYFVKTQIITATTIIENYLGSGGGFDDNPIETKVVEIYSNGIEERVITENGDSSYYVIIFKNFTANKASVCMNSEEFKNIEDAKMYTPSEGCFSDWYTEAGYKIENDKPAMPEMTKKDVLEFSNYMAEIVKKVKEETKATPETVTEADKFALVLILSTVPGKYADLTGFNIYKSRAILERGMTKYENDPDVKKIFKSAGLVE